MTKAEATYWKEYIERVITSRLSTLTNVEIDAAQIRTFADRHMQLITGQQLLPQTIFRIFVEEFAPISEWQEQLRELMEEFNGPYVALTDEEMDAIFELDPEDNEQNGGSSGDGENEEQVPALNRDKWIFVEGEGNLANQVNAVSFMLWFTYSNYAVWSNDDFSLKIVTESATPEVGDRAMVYIYGYNNKPESIEIPANSPLIVKTVNLE